MAGDEPPANLVPIWEFAEELISSARLVRDLELGRNPLLAAATRDDFVGLDVAVDRVMDAYESARASADEVARIDGTAPPFLWVVDSPEWARSLSLGVDALSEAAERISQRYLENAECFPSADREILHLLIGAQATYSAQADSAAAWRASHTLTLAPAALTLVVGSNHQSRDSDGATVSTSASALQADLDDPQPREIAVIISLNDECATGPSEVGVGPHIHL